MTRSAVAHAVTDFAKEVSERLERLLALAVDGGLDEAIGLMTKAIETGAVIQASGPAASSRPTRLLFATSHYTAVCRCRSWVVRAWNATRASLRNCGMSRRYIVGTCS